MSNSNYVVRVDYKSDLPEEIRGAERELKRVNSALRVYNQQMKNAKSVAANDAVAKSTKNFKNLGHTAQQAGYQVGDFAVQVASGQSAVTAFVQQGTQMLGVFGAWGAVAGAAVAITGALYKAFATAEEETVSLNDAMDDLKSQTGSLNGLFDDQSDALKELEKSYGEVSEAAKALYAIESQIQSNQLAASIAAGIAAVDQAIQDSDLQGKFFRTFYAEGGARGRKAVAQARKQAIESVEAVTATINQLSTSTAPLEDALDVINELKRVSEETGVDLKEQESAVLGIAKARAQQLQLAQDLQVLNSTSVEKLQQEAALEERKTNAIKEQVRLTSESRSSLVEGGFLASDDPTAAFNAFSGDQFNPEGVGNEEELERQLQAREAFYLQQADMARVSADEQLAIEQEMLMQREEAYNQFYANIEKKQIAESRASIGHVDSMAGSVMSILQNLDQEQSALYKGMFVTQQAAAIATALVKVQEAQAQALANGGGVPWSLPFVAATAALGAQIIGSITSVSGMFDKGGHIPAGTVGIVGEFGPELVSGPAMVTSRQRTSEMLSGGGETTVIINNNVDGTRATASERETDDGQKVVEVTIETISNLIASGGNRLSQSFENSYSLSRAGRAY